MDLNHLAVFIRVVEEKSFTAAARALAIPKSSVSRSVAHLEDELGVKLLHRTTRRTDLTEAGAKLVARVSPALDDIREAASAVSDLQEEIRGPVRLTAPHDLGVEVLARLVRSFTKRYPAVEVDVHLSSRVVHLAAEGFDLAVRGGAVRDTSLVARTAGSFDLRLYASRRYAAARGLPTTPADVERHDCVRHHIGDGGVVMTHTDGATTTIQLGGPVGTDDLSFVKRSVLCAAGIGLLPEYLCVREERSGKLVRVLPEWAYRTGIVHVVYPAARYVPQRVLLLRDHLVRGLTVLRRQCEETAARGDEARAVSPSA
jgi:DNA-binding transcriptional LysR family regulator